ncbi:MAG: FecR domain-containing protein, partial [Bacteroidetes bacterium]|nr:FecR domain-containing protein [Bacteroidota bacterium]
TVAALRHRNLTGEGQSIEMLVIDSSATEKVELDLADRTNVVLNVNSKISYPRTFDGDKRIVKLEGEAFFNVETDSTKPFVIHVGDGRIVVKGTSFNVNANNPDSIVVTVKEGVIQFYHEGSDQSELLTVDGKGTLMASSDEVVKADNDNDNYLFWYDGKLWFKNTSLKNVVAKLNKEWNVGLSIADEAIEGCPVTASLTSEEVEKILRLLEMTLDIRVEVEDEKYVIYGEGC